MTAPLALLCFAVLASVGGSRGLQRAAWPTRNPALGIWAWQALSVAVASAIGMAGLALALPELPMRNGVADFLRACATALTRHYETPGGWPVAAVALGASLLLAGRFVFLFAAGLCGGRRHRQRLLDGLTLVASDHPDGFKSVHHPAPMIYCLPGRQPAVVVTSAAQELLTPHQLHLVLGHEQTHLRVRHDIALTAASALSRTFGGRGVFRHAHDAIATLAEMHADDAAHLRTDRRDLARALLALIPTATVPTAALASNGLSAVQRVRRLTGSPPRRLARRHSFAAGLAGLGILAAPVALALAPAIEAALRDCCPPPTALISTPQS